MKGIDMIRQALFALAIVVGLVVFPVAPAQAQKYCGVTAQCAIYFFAESQKIHIVGQYMIFCGGEVYQWGVQTPYQIAEDQLCEPL